MAPAATTGEAFTSCGGDAPRLLERAADPLHCTEIYAKPFGILRTPGTVAFACLPDRLREAQTTKMRCGVKATDGGNSSRTTHPELIAGL